MATILPIVELTELPEVGEQNIDYRLLFEDGSSLDYIWNGDSYTALPFDSRIVNAFFSPLIEKMESMISIIEELSARVSALEGDSQILYMGNNISLIEGSASIEKTVSVLTDIELPEVADVEIELSDMTIDGIPIENIKQSISLANLPAWDWKGGELYSEVFGNSAYFSFGTKPMNGIVNQITLGFTNEQESFEERTLFIGHIKVEVMPSSPTKQNGGKK